MKKHPETDVDRSRLTLLLGLSSTAAAAGCFGPPRGDDPPSGWRAPAAPVDRSNADPFDADRPGGEGEGEGGGGH